MSTPVSSTPTYQKVKLVRSPVFITGKNNTLALDTLDSMTLQLKIYSGAMSGVPTTADYQLSKNYSINQIINFEISNLLRDKFSFNPSVVNVTTLWNLTPSTEIYWVKPTGDWTYSNNGTVPITAPWTITNNYFLITKGWSIAPNFSNPSLTGYIYFLPRTRRVLSTSFDILPIQNNAGITRIDITWNDGSTYTMSTTGKPSSTSTNSYQQILYVAVGPANLETMFIPPNIKPSAHGCDDYYDVMFYASTTLVHYERYQMMCECKYTPYQICYVNRYGFKEYMTWFKRSDEFIDVSADSYKASVYQDGFTAPVGYSRQYTDYNVNARKSIILNSDWVGEGYKNVIEDIVMSEDVWINVSGNWFACSPERGSIEMKKEVNDKLINYTMKFTYAVDERPLLR